MREDGKTRITLTWDKCSDCPYAVNLGRKDKYACGHLKMLVAKPYAKDRSVPVDGFAEFCPMGTKS